MNGPSAAGDGNDPLQYSLAVEVQCAHLGLPPPPTAAQGHLFTGPAGRDTLFLWSATGEAAGLVAWAANIGDPAAAFVSSDGRVARVQLAALDPLWRAMVTAGGSRFRADPDGTLTVRSHGPRDALRTLLEEVSALDPDVRVQQAGQDQGPAASDAGPESPLTDRQAEAVRMAFERGYFDTPRTTDLRALADELGITAPSLSHLLRRAYHGLVSTYLEDTRAASRSIKQADGDDA